MAGRVANVKVKLENSASHNLLTRRSPTAHSTWREMSWRHGVSRLENANSRYSIRWRHISRQVEWARREHLGTRLRLSQFYCFSWLVDMQNFVLFSVNRVLGPRQTTETVVENCLVADYKKSSITNSKKIVIDNKTLFLFKRKTSLVIDKKLSSFIVDNLLFLDCGTVVDNYAIISVRWQVTIVLDMRGKLARSRIKIQSLYW